MVPDTHTHAHRALQATAYYMRRITVTTAVRPTSLFVLTAGGKIPTEVGHLDRLTELTLSGCILYGA